MNKTINIILITVLICVSIYSVLTENWYILIANISVISGVLIDSYATKRLLQKHSNYKLIRIIQKIIVPTLYVLGAIALSVMGYVKYLSD